jgi:hypothetical protein
VYNDFKEKQTKGEFMNCLTQTSHRGSNKFGFISSENLVTRLESQGLKLANVVESKIRKDKALRQGYQKHVLRFDTGLSNRHGNLQLLAINSHEGSSALTFRMGFFRMVCSNGLIIGSDLIPQIKVRHTHNGLLKLDDSIEELLDYRIVAMDNIEKMENRKLSQDEFEALAIASAKIRMGDKFTDKIMPLFEAKRYEDNTPDLFTAFNVIQENVMRTGFYALNKDTNAAVKVRAIRGVNASLDINMALYNEAMKLVA